MLKDLTEHEQKLEEFMSWISEEGHSAGWMCDLEYDLWEIVVGGDRRYSRYSLSQDDIDKLNLLSQKCGCWIVFDDVSEETAVGLETWKKMYSGKIIADQIIRQVSEFTPFGDDDLENDNVHYLYDLLKPLEDTINAARAIEPIFSLIEKYPNVDFGSPGPLVHFLEKLRGQYEKSLHRSLDRRPTPLTVWMFNRITNAEKDPIQKSKLIEALTNLLSHPKIDVKTIDEIKFFVEFQNKSK
jgi:hypothetical protein